MGGHRSMLFRSTCIRGARASASLKRVLYQEVLWGRAAEYGSGSGPTLAAMLREARYAVSSRPAVRSQDGEKVRRRRISRRTTAPRKSSNITPQFDPGWSRCAERTSKSTDFSAGIIVCNQQLKNPYCIGEVRSFGENRRRENEFDASGQLRGQQLLARKRAVPGVFRGRIARRRLLCAT